MPSGVVRIYNGEPGASVLGWSLSAASAPDSPRFKEFMTDRGYEYADSAPVLHGGPGRYIETRPPLKDEDVQALAKLCMAGALDQKREPVVILDSRSVDMMIHPTDPRFGGVL